MNTAASSPCIGVCRMDPNSGWCEGCLRTLDEIAVWSLLDDSEKQAVCESLTLRALPAKTTGHQGDLTG